MKAQRFETGQQVMVKPNEDVWRELRTGFIYPLHSPPDGVPLPDQVVTIDGYDHWDEEVDEDGGQWMITLVGFDRYCFSEDSFQPIAIAEASDREVEELELMIGI